jgi:hypothetical protein
VTQDVHRQRFNQLTRHSDQPGDVHLVSDKALAIETRAVEDPKPWTQQLIQYSLYVVWLQLPLPSLNLFYSCSKYVIINHFP